MHSSLLLVGHVVHVSFHSSFVPKVIPWKKMTVKFGLLELQVGFKSCTKYFCKENEKVNKILQTSLENDLNIHEIKRMQYTNYSS
jgi:cadmium resistance protein CadD (predicted permease)